MEPVYYAVITGVAVYVVLLLVIRRRLTPAPNRTRTVLDKLEQESGKHLKPKRTPSVLRDEMMPLGPLGRAATSLPGGKRFYQRILRAGLAPTLDRFLLICLVSLLVLGVTLRSAGTWGLLAALLLTAFGAHMYINRRIAKRNLAFVASFPDALDMIVRSVRSGYPLSTAVKMVAENMPAPVSTEFRQVSDETSYGSSLIEALQRLATRIDEPDIRFFVVVLAVQQEVGGNLAEVLSNLSGIIRKRKHLYMKVRALSSEGRATAWVLGLLPVFEFLAIYFVSPGHLTPLFVTPMGNMILLSAISIVLVGVLIVRQIINIEV